MSVCGYCGKRRKTLYPIEVGAGKYRLKCAACLRNDRLEFNAKAKSSVKPFTPNNYVQEHGGTFRGGINWTWVDFDTVEQATQFEALCTANNYETRGVSGTSVRFR